MTGDNSFCIIIEQRIPTTPKINRNPDSSITITSMPINDEFVELKNNFSIPGISTDGSTSNFTTTSAEINGENKGFMFKFSVYNFIINEKKSNIIFTKDKFKNLPSDFYFADIKI